MATNNKKRTSLYYDEGFFRIVDDWRMGPGRNKKTGEMFSRNQAIIEMVKRTAKRDKISIDIIA